MAKSLRLDTKTYVCSLGEAEIMLRAFLVGNAALGPVHGVYLR